jgi:pimeloyl-ACP methyl ester carboxylesterase
MDRAGLGLPLPHQRERGGVWAGGFSHETRPSPADAGEGVGRHPSPADAGEGVGGPSSCADAGEEAGHLGARAGPDSGARPGTLVFSHANGFPAGTYRVLFERWRAAGWRVEAIEQFGHDPRYPVTSNWPHMTQQLADFVAERCREPAWLVGHSLGGLLSLLAAARQPERVRGVVLLDAPVIAGWRAHTLRLVKLTGLVRRLGPGRVSRQRRHQWPSPQDAHQHFATKPVFARWDPRVLEDYVRVGTQAGKDGTQLSFRRDIETRIYNTLPHNLGQLLRRRPPGYPVWFIGGTHSLELRQAGLAATRHVTQGRLEWVEGSHLFPFEKPEETAALVLRLLSAPQAGHL